MNLLHFIHWMIYLIKLWKQNKMRKEYDVVCIYDEKGKKLWDVWCVRKMDQRFLICELFLSEWCITQITILAIQSKSLSHFSVVCSDYHRYYRAVWSWQRVLAFFVTNNFALKLTAKKFSFFFYPNNFNLKKPIYLLTHTSTHTKIHFLHIVRQFLEHACSIDTYKPYTNSNCITIDFEKNRISNVISFISL